MMVTSTRFTRFKYMSLLVTFSLVLVFFLLLNNIQTVRITKIIEGPGFDITGLKFPGEYVKYVHPMPSNTSYCKLNYGLPRKFRYDESDLSGTPELDKDSPYFVLYDVVEGSISDSEPRVTYATHVTKDFVVYISEIVRYWDGPVSVAAYLPDGNPQGVLDQILNFCYCIPEMSRLSLHLVFRSGLEPMNMYKGDVNIPPNSCDIQNLSKVDNENIFSTTESSNATPSHSTESWYPINVCRNIARQSAYTEFIMVCDVELMPSQGLASRFLDMTESYKCTDDQSCAKRVFVTPVFEVEATEELPRTKTQLVNLMYQEKAVYFHRLICTHCQKFPGLEQWKESDPGDIVKPLLDTKREGPYHRWEPIYIGTKNEPLYNERLSWEGFQDKMLQMLEMCLAGYKLVVLDGAFLVHWPGIKKTKSKTLEPWRKPFIDMNQKHYDLLLKNLTARYSPNPQCKVK